MLSKLRYWEPKDVIALVIILGCITLLIMGRDSIVAYTLLGMVGAYYGLDLTPFVKLGRNQKGKGSNNESDN